MMISPFIVSIKRLVTFYFLNAFINAENHNKIILHKSNWNYALFKQKIEIEYYVAMVSVNVTVTMAIFIKMLEYKRF